MKSRILMGLTRSIEFFGSTSMDYKEILQKAWNKRSIRFGIYDSFSYQVFYNTISLLFDQVGEDEVKKLHDQGLIKHYGDSFPTFKETYLNYLSGENPPPNPTQKKIIYLAKKLGFLEEFDLPMVEKEIESLKKQTVLSSDNFADWVKEIPERENCPGMEQFLFDLLIQRPNTAPLLNPSSCWLEAFAKAQTQTNFAENEQHLKLLKQWLSEINRWNSLLILQEEKLFYLKDNISQSISQIILNLDNLELADKIQNNLQNHQQEIEQLKASVEQLRTEIEQHLNKIRELEQQLTAKTTELSQELTKTQQLQQDLTNLQIQKNANETNLKQQIKAKESELQKTLTESKESTAGLRKEIEELKVELQESKEISKRELEEEQEKLKQVQQNIQQQVEANTRQERQTIEELQTKLINSEKVLKETQETLAQSQSKITQLETKLLDHEQLKERHEQKIAQQEKTLAHSQSVAQEQISLAQQKIADLEKQLLDLAKQKVSIQKQLAQSQDENTTQARELTQAQEQVQAKQEQLKKTRLEVASLQSKLKNMPSPRPDKPVLPQNKPIDPWILGIILVVAVGMLWMLNKSKLAPAQELAQKNKYGN